MQKRGITSFRSKFFVSEYRKISLRNISVYRKISGIEKYYASERWGGITFLRRKLLSHSTEKFRWGTVRCFRKFRVSENFGYRKILCIREREGGGGYHVSPSKTFVTQYRKISLGNSSVFQKIPCIGKFRVSKNIMHQRERGGGYHVSPSKTFVTQYRKISLGNSSVFQKVSYIAKFYA